MTPNAVGVAGGLPGATVRFLRFEEADAIGGPDGARLVGTLADIAGPRTAGAINSSKIEFDLRTVEYHNWQGGGGFGDPLDRDPAKVRDDVRLGLVSAEQAEKTYGVVLGDGVDASATTALRAELRRGRLARAHPFTEAYPLPEDSGVGEPASGLEAVGYWDILAIDHAADSISCVGCGHRLTRATADVRTGCVVEEIPAWKAGPIHGSDYVEASTVPIAVRMFYCPGCGRQLEADLVVPGGIGPASVVTRGGATGAPSS